MSLYPDNIKLPRWEKKLMPSIEFNKCLDGCCTVLALCKKKGKTDDSDQTHAIHFLMFFVIKRQFQYIALFLTLLGS